MRGVDDLLSLGDFNEGALLHNIRVRYFKDEIYTGIGGPILISVFSSVGKLAIPTKPSIRAMCLAMGAIIVLATAHMHMHGHRHRHRHRHRHMHRHMHTPAHIHTHEQTHEHTQEHTDMHRNTAWRVLNWWLFSFHINGIINWCNCFEHNHMFNYILF